MKETIEIQVAGPNNDSLAFRPLQRTIRGRFDLNNVNEPKAMALRATYPQPIPGQIIGIDPNTNEGYIREPLREERYAAIRERIEAQGLKLASCEEKFMGVDPLTWAYWMRRAVDSGLAHVVKGKLPERIDASKIQRNSIVKPQRSRSENLVSALVAILYSQLSDAQ